MHTSVMKLNVSEFLKMASVLSVVDNQGNITYGSICQALAQETDKTIYN
ncbi:MAG: hypothetical protein V7K50_17670 [Nostoc sp.]